MKMCEVSRPKLVLHSIRKFLNDYLANCNVAFEVRCQFMGHEIDNVNVEIYKNIIPINKLIEAVKPAQTLLAKDLKIIK